MGLKIAIQMDPIASVDIDADSTFRLAEEAQARGTSCSITRRTTSFGEMGSFSRAVGHWRFAG